MPPRRVSPRIPPSPRRVSPRTPPSPRRVSPGLLATNSSNTSSSLITDFLPSFFNNCCSSGTNGSGSHGASSVDHESTFHNHHFQNHDDDVHRSWFYDIFTPVSENNVNSTTVIGGGRYTRNLKSTIFNSEDIHQFKDENHPEILSDFEEEKEITHVAHVATEKAIGIFDYILPKSILDMFNNQDAEIIAKSKAEGLQIAGLKDDDDDDNYEEETEEEKNNVDSLQSKVDIIVNKYEILKREYDAKLRHATPSQLNGGLLEIVGDSNYMELGILKKKMMIFIKDL